MSTETMTVSLFLSVWFVRIRYRKQKGQMSRIESKLSYEYPISIGVPLQYHTY